MRVGMMSITLAGADRRVDPKRSKNGACCKVACSQLMQPDPFLQTRVSQGVWL